MASGGGHDGVGEDLAAVAFAGVGEGGDICRAPACVSDVPTEGTGEGGGFVWEGSSSQ